MSHLEIYLRGLTIDQLLIESGIDPKYIKHINMDKQEMIQAILIKQARYNKTY